jgi:hypothetical protein
MQVAIASPFAGAERARRSRAPFACPIAGADPGK